MAPVVVGLATPLAKVIVSLVPKATALAADLFVTVGLFPLIGFAPVNLMVVLSPV